VSTETKVAEGIVIKAVPFRDYDCILSVFTPTEGLLKLILKSVFRGKKPSGTTTPLSIVEAVYTKGRNDLHTCREINVTRHHLHLRQDFKVLEAACDLLKAIALTQLPEKAAPELYQLLLMYLEGLPVAADPLAIVSSFQLKLLRYEGILPQFEHCSFCESPLSEVWFYENEAFCIHHTPARLLVLSPEERHFFTHLAFCRDLTKLLDNCITKSLSEKIARFFSESLAT
jgi:DNA repair protein RecO (recombination protein O)